MPFAFSLVDVCMLLFLVVLSMLMLIVLLLLLVVVVVLMMLLLLLLLAVVLLLLRAETEDKSSRLTDLIGANKALESQLLQKTIALEVKRTIH